MFGHLKAEDFINLMDGASLPNLVMDKRRRHLESCARCAETLKSVEAVRNQVAEMQMSADEYIPEPDWSEFRGDVRNALLSRSVKRESANRSFLVGMTWKPVATWGFSLLLVLGLTTSVVLWNGGDVEPRIQQIAENDDFAVSAGALHAIAEMKQTNVFEDLLRLDEHETESLKVLLEDLTDKGVAPQ